MPCHHAAGRPDVPGPRSRGTRGPPTRPHASPAGPGGRRRSADPAAAVRQSAPSTEPTREPCPAPSRLHRYPAPAGGAFSRADRSVRGDAVRARSLREQPPPGEPGGCRRRLREPRREGHERAPVTASQLFRLPRLRGPVVSAPSRPPSPLAAEAHLVSRPAPASGGAPPTWPPGTDPGPCPPPPGGERGLACLPVLAVHPRRRPAREPAREAVIRQDRAPGPPHPVGLRHGRTGYGADPADACAAGRGAGRLAPVRRPHPPGDRRRAAARPACDRAPADHLPAEPAGQAARVAAPPSAAHAGAGADVSAPALPAAAPAAQRTPPSWAGPVG